MSLVAGQGRKGPGESLGRVPLAVHLLGSIQSLPSFLTNLGCDSRAKPQVCSKPLILAVHPSPVAVVAAAPIVRECDPLASARLRTIAAVKTGKSAIPIASQKGYTMRCTRRAAIASIFLGTWGLVERARGEAAMESWESIDVRLPHREGRVKPPIVTALAIRATGKQVAIAGDDHLVRIWDVGERRFTSELSGHVDLVRAVAYSSDGTLLASAGNDGRLLIWDAATNELLRQHHQQYPVTRIVFDHSDTHLATVGYRSPLRCFDVRDGREIRALSCPCEDMRAVAASPDDRYIAAGGRNGLVRVWEMTSGEIVHEFAAHRQRIRALEFSPDSELIASCGDDRVVRVSVVDGRDPILLKGPPAKVMSLTFCGPRQIAAGGSDNLIRIWDVDSRAESARLSGHTGSIMALVYSGTTLASAGYDTSVRIWKRTHNVAGDPPSFPRRVGGRTSANESR